LCRYIYGYPWHLPDGTISRPITWPEEGLVDPRGGGVWVDDMYMGTALLVQQALLTQDSTASTASWHIARLYWKLLKM
jgi:hypothetical protein